MIRPSLRKAIESALDFHIFLARSDFQINEYQDKDTEPCLAVVYRSDLKFCFVVTVTNEAFSVTMTPGREAFKETLSIAGRHGLIEELRVWQRRLHEDVGVFPIDRQFEAHIRRISRMESCLGLTSKASVDAGTGFFEELSRWEAMLHEFIAASQATHQSVLLWYLKTRLNEIKKLEECLQAAGDAFALRRDLEEMRRSIATHIESAVMLLEKLEARQLCLVEREVFIPMSRLFESDSKNLDEIRDRMPVSSSKATSLIEDLKSFRERLTPAPRALKSYYDDERIQTLKNHLANANHVREQFEGGSTSVEEIKQTLDRMRKDISVLSSRNVMEKEEIVRVGRNVVQRFCEDDGGPALKYLEEKLRTTETSARTFLGNLMNPLFCGENVRAVHERALESLLRKKQILSAAIRLLKEDQEANQRFLKMMSQSGPADTQ